MLSLYARLGILSTVLIACSPKSPSEVNQPHEPSQKELKITYQQQNNLERLIIETSRVREYSQHAEKWAYEDADGDDTVDSITTQSHTDCIMQHPFTLTRTKDFEKNRDLFLRGDQLLQEYRHFQR